MNTLNRDEFELLKRAWIFLDKTARTFYLLLPIENKTSRMIDIEVRWTVKKKRFRLFTLLGEASPHHLGASCKPLEPQFITDGLLWARYKIQIPAGGLEEWKISFVQEKEPSSGLSSPSNPSPWKGFKINIQKDISKNKRNLWYKLKHFKQRNLINIINDLWSKFVKGGSN